MDVNDTIFIRNLSFDTEQETLKEFIEENFGKTNYCLVCMDKETGESKGTAFAKFEDPEDASKCLVEFKDREKQTKFNLDGRNLMVFPSITREKVQEIKELGAKKKDKRNVSLATEGYIKPSSEEGKEMSKNDLEKRKVLEARKRDKLKNLHNFVSDVRLCIHNLPPSVDNEKLRKICLKSVIESKKDSKPKVIECRVMRNKKANGKLDSSKGFAFVAFNKPEFALACLRNLNNNPSIFSKDKRPIVEFSIENMVAINKKKTRLARSKQKLQEEKTSNKSAKPKVKAK